MNRLLALFGLIKISRAEHLTTLLHRHYAEAVVNGVLDDFGARPRPKFLTHTEAWWKKEFRSVLKHNTDDVTITTIPKFKR